MDYIKKYLRLIDCHYDDNIQNLFHKIPEKTDNIMIFGLHINDTQKYPFVQLLLEKFFHNEANREELQIPVINWENNFDNMELKINNFISEVLDSFFIKEKPEKYPIYLSILDNNYSFIIDFSSVNMDYLQLELNRKYWFALQVEIYNSHRVSNNIICKKSYIEVLCRPYLFSLYKSDSEIYPVASVAYSSSTTHKNAQFQSIFGLNTDEKLNKKYFSLHSNMNEAIKSLKEKYSDDDNKIQIGINRYVYFDDNFFVMQRKDNLFPEAKIVEHLFENKGFDTIYITYKRYDKKTIENPDEKYEIYPNIILKNSNQHYPLTSHLIVV